MWTIWRENECKRKRVSTTTTKSISKSTLQPRIKVCKWVNIVCSRRIILWKLKSRENFTVSRLKWTVLLLTIKWLALFLAVMRRREIFIYKKALYRFSDIGEKEFIAPRIVHQILFRQNENVYTRHSFISRSSLSWHSEWLDEQASARTFCLELFFFNTMNIHHKISTENCFGITAHHIQTEPNRKWSGLHLGESLLTCCFFFSLSLYRSSLS